MTRRERLERKIALRQKWAEGRKDKAETLNSYCDRFRGDVAFNTQPGHIPERARVIRKTEQAWEHEKMAIHHESKADGLARQLDRSIFSDDNNSIAALEARVAEREAERDTMKRVNALFRKGDSAGLAEMGLNLDALKAAVGESHSWDKQPYPRYSITNIGARIRADKKRIEEIKIRQARMNRAEAAGGVVVEGDEWVRVTFSEKPPREVLDALKAAGFYWGGGSWVGLREKLPIQVSKV